MKIIHRYIFTETLKIFALSTMFLTMVMFLDKAMFMTDLILNRGLTILEVGQMILYISPIFLSITIPISVLVAAVVTFNQFSAESEFVVMKSCGWSFMYLLRPVLLFSFLAYIATNIIIFYALPVGNQALKQMIFDIVKTRANINIKPNVFNRDFDNMILMVKEKKGPNSFKGVFIADSSFKGSTKIILSEQGSILTDPANLRIQLQLRNGSIHDLAKQGEDYQIMKFDRYDLTLDIPGTDQLKKKQILKPREMSISELQQQIKKNEKREWQDDLAKVELSKRFSIPLTCILFGIIGVPLGITSRRSGKSGGFVYVLLIILMYYVSMVLMQNFGRSGRINPYFSVWIPNIVLLIFAVYIGYKTQREMPFRTFNKINELVSTLWEYLLKKFGTTKIYSETNNSSKNQD
ncbi:MAG: LPS export ABC transporter permease LptF [Nitrospinaceae bacterium]